MAKNWHCIDCNKLIWNRFLRCKSCSHKGNINQKGQFGADNPNWRGGIAKHPYTFRFTRIRPFIHQRYKVCQMCGSSEKLVVHHLNHDRKDNNVNNLITLCSGCNGKEQSNILYYQMILGYKIAMKAMEIMRYEDL